MRCQIDRLVNQRCPRDFFNRKILTAHGIIIKETPRYFGREYLGQKPTNNRRPIYHRPVRRSPAAMPMRGHNFPKQIVRRVYYRFRQFVRERATPSPSSFASPFLYFRRLLEIVQYGIE